jgi:hypothetical protein
VRFLAQSGIRQFIDLGTGIPTSPSVHEVARSVDPATRVVYVDNDPIVSVHNDALLASEVGIVTIQADIRRPDEIMDDPRLRKLIDFGEPVRLLIVTVFHVIPGPRRPSRDRCQPPRAAAGGQLAEMRVLQRPCSRRNWKSSGPTRWSGHQRHSGSTASTCPPRT